MDALQGPDRYEIYAPPQANLADPAIALHQPLFFPVGLTKLAVLSVCTLGFYIIYWFYKSWRQAPGRSGRSANAALAAIFCSFTAYSLFREIGRFSAGPAGSAPFSAGALAFCFFVIGAAGWLPDSYGLVGLLAFVPLLPVAQCVNRLNIQSRPLADRNERFSPPNIVGAAIGGVVLLAAVGEMIWGQAS